MTEPRTLVVIGDILHEPCGSISLKGRVHTGLADCEPPAAARPSRGVVCRARDRSLQMNIQELQIVRHHQLPVKLFASNNLGHLSSCGTQQNSFGATVGSAPGDGVAFPDYSAGAAAYGPFLDPAELARNMPSRQGQSVAEAS